MFDETDCAILGLFCSSWHFPYSRRCKFNVILGALLVSCMSSLEYCRIGTFPDVTRRDMEKVFLDQCGQRLKDGSSEYLILLH